MPVRTRLSALMGAACVSVAAFGFAVPTYAKPGDVVLRCNAKGADETAIHASFVQRPRSAGVRQKFTAEFEADSAGRFHAGEKIGIVVDTVQVGRVTLAQAPSGELSGQIEFDSKLGEGHPFPPDFPDVAAGSTVEAAVRGKTILGCELH